MNLLDHAKIELDAIGMTEDSEDEMNRAMRKHLLHMVSEFAHEGHSGFSASYAADILNKLFKYKPLCPLTGEDSEWVDVAMESGYPLYQNKRCSHVFKSNGQAYDINGKIFYDSCVGEDGQPFKSYYTNSDSRVIIEFPYTPTSEYLERPND